MLARAWEHWIARWFRLERAPGAERRDNGGFREDLRNIGALARKELPLLCVGVTFLLVAAGVRVLIPQRVAETLVIALKPETAAEAPQLGALRRSALRLAGLAVAYGVTAGLRGLVMSIVENRMLEHLRRQTFTSILKQDIAFHDVRQVGELASRLNSDCEAVAHGISANFNIFLRSLVQLVFGVIYLATTSWKLTLMVLLVWALLFQVYMAYGSFARRSSVLRQDRVAAVNTLISEGFYNIRTVRSMGAEDAVLAKFARASDDFIFVEHQRGAAYGLYNLFYNSLTESIKAVALGTGGLLLARGSIGGEQLAAAMLYVDQTVFSSLSVGGQYRQLMQAIGSSKRVFEFAKLPPSSSVELEVGSPGIRIHEHRLEGAVRFQDVYFGYAAAAGESVLRGLTLDLAPGEVTAIVGASGAGKSTVAALLQRWYDPDDGQVLLDGVDIRDLDPRWFRSILGVVQQEPHLFSASVWENIALGLPRGDMSEGEMDLRVREAARAAQAYDFIERLPRGFETLVGDARLSGGQRQRLALARALARRPRLLVLDEATAALDRRTEAMVQASIAEYLRQNLATVLVIAHRLSTVEAADKIVVLDRGRVAEEGTHRELTSRNGLYSQLVRGALAV